MRFTQGTSPVLLPPKNDYNARPSQIWGLTSKVLIHIILLGLLRPKFFRAGKESPSHERRARSTHYGSYFIALTCSGGGSKRPLKQPASPVESYVGPISPEEARRKEELVSADEAVVARPRVGVRAQGDSVAGHVPHDLSIE